MLGAQRAPQFFIALMMHLSLSAHLLASRQLVPSFHTVLAFTPTAVPTPSPFRRPLSPLHGHFPSMPAYASLCSGHLHPLICLHALMSCLYIPPMSCACPCPFALPISTILFGAVTAACRRSWPPPLQRKLYSPRPCASPSAPLSRCTAACPLPWLLAPAMHWVHQKPNPPPASPADRYHL